MCSSWSGDGLRRRHRRACCDHQDESCMMRTRHWCAFSQMRWRDVWMNSRRNGKACPTSLSLRARVRPHLLQAFVPRIMGQRVTCVVVNMAKEKQWEDVRLLSFDLQTVEFTYASVRITPSPFTTLVHV